MYNGPERICWRDIPADAARSLPAQAHLMLHGYNAWMSAHRTRVVVS
jgi:hypothetical protein